MATHVESVCPLDCPDTCSLSVTLDSGRITSVDASERNPVTDGFICSKVRQYARRVYSPLRVYVPQRRVGKKGEGRFEPISWEEAIALVATNLRKVADKYGAEAILPYHYGGSNGLFSEDGADARFFHLLGASKLKKTLCAGPTGAASRGMYGTMAGVPMADYKRARFILLWGVNPSATSIHMMAAVREAQKAGAFVVVVDPRRTKAAATADLHLAPRPGTDVVLALAIAGRIIAQGRVARTFVDASVQGYDEFAAAAARYTIEDAARICGVPAVAIASLADRYAQASPAVLRCGWGLERNRNAGNAVRAVLALPAIAGKFGVQGGGFTMSLSRAFPIDSAALSRPDLVSKPVREINMSQLGRVLTEPLDPPVKALFVYNCNPIAVTPDQNRVARGLEREDLFTVVHEQVMTDTARYADVLLPATTVFEQRELHKAYGHFYLQYSEPVIEPVGEALSNTALFGRLAEALGLGSPQLFDEDEMLRAAIGNAGARLSTPGLDALKRDRIARVRFEYGEDVVQFGNSFPTTPSGKVELMPDGFGPIVYTPLESSYPLTLLSPATNKTINSIFGEFNLTKPKLEMHPEDAAVRGLVGGEVVRAFNQLGEVQVPVAITDSVRPGVVSLPKGLWRLATLNGSTSNALIPDHLSDYGEGACYNDARVEVEAVAGR